MSPAAHGGIPLRILVAGGGTGGHLYPGIAVVRELLARDSRTIATFVGTARGIEARVIPREGFALDVIRSSGFKGTSIATRARGVVTLPVSAVDAWRVVAKRHPHVVIGVGGYSSGPVVMLAALRGIPTLLLEQNAVPGLTNRLLAPMVRAAAVTYDTTLPFFKGKGFVSGNPVRAEFFGASDAPAAEPGAPLRVLIVGGSQGAHAINVAAVEAAPRLAGAAGSVAITHQTGERDVEMVREGYRRAGLAARVEPFLFEMDREMKQADLLVCRAGATTLAELTAAGRPSILVPLPTATDDHQRRNAEVLVRAGAAEAIEQRELTGEVLAARIAALGRDRTTRERMAHAARALARPHAARMIADRVLALAGRSAA